MLKTTFLIRDLNYGGAQRQLVTLVKSLHKQGSDITVLHFYPGGALEKDLKDSGIPTICLEKQKRWDVVGFFRRFFGQLKSLQPDVLHSYLGESNLAAVFLKPFFPHTRIIWGIRESNTPVNQYGWVGWMLSQLERLLSPFTDAIVVNSHAGKAHYLKVGFPAGKMLVIPNGIDIERFKPDADARAKVRSEWGISDQTILIGLVGRLDPMKDHPNFLQAAARLSAQRQDLRFVCVGSGSREYAQKLEQLTSELGLAEKLIWAGARSDMCAVHNAIDLTVSASAYGEGFPNAIGEAMACGVPCVVTDVGDLAGIVGDLGIVVPPQDPSALYSAIARSLDCLDSCDRASIRQRIVTQFSVNQLVLKTQAVLLNSQHLDLSQNISDC